MKSKAKQGKAKAKTRQDNTDIFIKYVSGFLQVGSQSELSLAQRCPFCSISCQNKSQRRGST